MGGGRRKPSEPKPGVRGLGAGVPGRNQRPRRVLERAGGRGGTRGVGVFQFAENSS
jgi:hypothetical protein